MNERCNDEWALSNNESFTKVAWIRVGTNTILTVHDKVITRNYRISLSLAESRNWVLKISNVIEEDRGWYMCQVTSVLVQLFNSAAKISFLQLNTDPIIYQEAYVEVVGMFARGYCQFSMPFNR